MGWLGIFILRRGNSTCIGIESFLFFRWFVFTVFFYYILGFKRFDRFIRIVLCRLGVFVGVGYFFFVLVVGNVGC